MILVHINWGKIMSVRKINGNYNFISENLKRIRKEKHFKQTDLIRELNLMGISMYKNDIWRIEKNKRVVKDYELWAIVKILNISYDDLFKDASNKLEE